MTEHLLYDDELDAARDAVKALGGAKKVGQQFWPDKTPEAAHRSLLDCLNSSRAERLTPSQLLLLMKWARGVGFHGLAGYYMQEAGYSQPVPVDPETEAAVLVRQVESAMDRAVSLVERLERIKGMGSH